MTGTMKAIRRPSPPRYLTQWCRSRAHIRIAPFPSEHSPGGSQTFSLQRTTFGRRLAAWVGRMDDREILHDKLSLLETTEGNETSCAPVVSFEFGPSRFRSDEGSCGP